LLETVILCELLESK